MTLDEIFEFINEKTIELDVKWFIKRGSLRCLMDSKKYCPLTFIYKLVKGEYVAVDRASLLCGDLDIDYFNGRNIMHAADLRSHPLRNRLKIACNKIKVKQSGN